MKTKVQFIHGLEGSPKGAKSVYLQDRYETTILAMDTSDFAACVAQQQRELERFMPDVLVGSSFGGAVALKLVQQGAHRGPTLLLAPAAANFQVARELPPDVSVTIVHGTADDIIDVGDSRVLARSGSPGRVQLIETDDSHRLESLLSTGKLGQIIDELAAAATSNART